MQPLILIHTNHLSEAFMSHRMTSVLSTTLLLYRAYVCACVSACVCVRVFVCAFHSEIQYKYMGTYESLQE